MRTSRTGSVVLTDRSRDRDSLHRSGLRTGGRGGRTSAYVTLGRNTNRSYSYGALHYDGRDRHRRGIRHYGYSPYYYSDYRPFGRRYGLGLGVGFYLGYSYPSAYYSQRYVYQFPYRSRIYDDWYYDSFGTSYYVTNNYTTSATDDTASVRYVDEGNGGERYSEPLDGPPTEWESDYPSLTAPDDRTPIGRGNAAFQAGLYEDARTQYVSAMLADERDGYSKFLYSLANFALGEYEVATMALRRAMTTTPELVEYPVDVRSLYTDVEIFERQLVTLEHYIQSAPREDGSRLLLGYLYFGGGNPGRALATLDAATSAEWKDETHTDLRKAIVKVMSGS